MALPILSNWIYLNFATINRCKTLNYDHVLYLTGSQSIKRASICSCSNRDEFYQRDSSQLAYWTDKPEIAGGRDLEQGGTWMAVTKAGRFAAITNFREVINHRDSVRSRGLLITDFLNTNIEPAEFSRNLIDQADAYSGYNLLYGTLPDQLHYYSNRSNQPPVQLKQGIYSLSNHLLDTPWPKVLLGKQTFEQVINNEAKSMLPSLFQLLGDRTTAKEDELPDTGVDLHFEKLLSSIYIEGEQYGTRCSSVITVDQFRQLRFTELTHDNNAVLADNPVTISFRL